MDRSIYNLAVLIPCARVSLFLTSTLLFRCSKTKLRLEALVFRPSAGTFAIDGISIVPPSVRLCINDDAQLPYRRYSPSRAATDVGNSATPTSKLFDQPWSSGQRVGLVTEWPRGSSSHGVTVDDVVGDVERDQVLSVGVTLVVTASIRMSVTLVAVLVLASESCFAYRASMPSCCRVWIHVRPCSGLRTSGSCIFLKSVFSPFLLALDEEVVQLFATLEFM